ncbi:phage tail protein [Hymenobacter jeollabukensis]|uniref:Phage tail protein n=1 Tax=Hymenobacter jeollabukensis TaxID=2025313 RepID=A0A5R8WS24_9BACT|nr:tail fiber protein [Hymenobacter jeollabukensis]TLM93932.1 phage tail protein [Hymenobacter jeollabukensis]
MDPFVGEIRLMPYSFTTRGWLPCDGRLLPIQSNTALFSLLGTRYGGNGQTTFALPDLRGRAVVGMGQGAGLSPYIQGEVTGTENVTLKPLELAMHSHSVTASVPANSARGTASSPQSDFYAATAPQAEQYGTAPNNGNMANLLSGTTAAVGGNQPHENRMPFLALAYFIAAQGVFPPRQ